MMHFLKGVRVIDFTQVISGPYATFMLAQQGADVIKLELPKGGDQARSMMRPDGPFWGCRAVPRCFWHSIPANARSRWI